MLKVDLHAVRRNDIIGIIQQLAVGRRVVKVESISILQQPTMTFAY